MVARPGWRRRHVPRRSAPGPGYLFDIYAAKEGNYEGHYQ